jgi:multidrug resistance efflux pump
MASGRVVGLSIVGVVALIVIIGGGGYYLNQQENYVSSSDASVQTDIVPITANGDGPLLSYDLHAGMTLKKGASIARIEQITGDVNLLAPITGTVIQNDAINREVVVPGEPVGYMADLNNLEVVAYIPETSIANVTVGRTVNVNIDAYPNTSFTGTVQEIGNASAVVTTGVQNTSLVGNFNRQTQRIPVYITLTGNEGKKLLPGMSAEVSIHRN